MKRFACAALTTLVALTSGPRLAEACGGCFHVPAENTVVTGHRMVVSISPQQSVLWDQIQYAGNPSEFSWVLPVKAGARVEVASDAFFEVLEAATTVSIDAPPEGCARPDFGGDSGFGCSADERLDGAAANEGGRFDSGVQVISEGSVGPYDTVTLSAEDPEALKRWLSDNGFVLPDDVAPIVDAYVAEDFDFIALKLSPNQGVQQMTPVRVVSPGNSVSLPLRMVAVGTGAQTDLVLYVIGEGRYQARGFENVVVPPQLVTWDFRADATDYASLRRDALRGNDGFSWLTSYARRGALLEPIQDAQGFVNLSVGDDPFSVPSDQRIIDAYFRQDNPAPGSSQEAVEDAQSCISRAAFTPGSMAKVVDLCDENGENCRTPSAEEIDARTLVCNGSDDVAVALLGLHPSDVVLTRMEASLPTAALGSDLVLEAAENQDEIAHRFTAGLKANACWDSEPAAAAAPVLPTSPRLPPGALYPLVFGGLGLLFATRRRRFSAAGG